MSKEQGDISELEFILRVKKLGLNVLMPYSSITKYDLIVDNGKKSIKVQVKSTSKEDFQRGKLRKRTYRVATSNGRHSKNKYQEGDFDICAVHIIPENLFYLLPYHAISSKTSLFYPEKKEHKFSQYKENWELLQ